MSEDQQTSDEDLLDESEFIEVTGFATRADWEDFYLATRQLARKHGLSVEHFELEPMPAGEPQGASEIEPDPHDTGSGSE